MTKVKSCARTCVDDCIRFMAFCQLLAGGAALVFAARMMYAESFFSSGDWKHVDRSWFVYTVAIYGMVMVSGPSHPANAACLASVKPGGCKKCCN